MSRSSSGFGASAVNPYLAMESCEDLVRSGVITGVTPEEAVRNVIKALGKGVLKIMSKMGISTISSYAGAQAFEAVGLSQEFIDEYFTGTTSKLGGVGIDVVATENLRPPPGGVPRRCGRARPRAPHDRRRVPVAPRRLAAPLQPRDGVPPAALDAQPPLRRVPRVHLARRLAGRGAHDAARHVRAPHGHAAAGADRRGRVGRVDRQALLHRRDELRLDLEGGARVARDRDEPARREVEHGRGRRGPRPPARPRAPQRDQAGRVGSVRRHEHVPHARRPTSRSSSRRAPSPARAASCRPRRCTRGSRALGTRPRASASSRRRRTTTSTRSKTSSSSSST